MELMTFSSGDGYRIRTSLTQPKYESRGIVQVVHGFGEGLEHYQDLAIFFADQGYIVLTHDQRGFGKETKSRGVHGDYALFLEDIEMIRLAAIKKFPGLPILLFGHSMGGNIALSSLIQGDPTRYQAAIIESPWLSLAHNPNPLLRFLAKGIGSLFPKVTVSSGLDVGSIAHDQDRVATMTTDGIYHTRISLKLFSDIFDWGQQISHQAQDLKVPTLLLGAGNEKIVSLPAIRSFARAAGDNLRYVEIPSAYHAIHMDDAQEYFYQVIRDFLREIEK